MALEETASYLDSLVATNPDGSADFFSTIDNHIRLIKGCLQRTFPNVTGAVTPTHTSLNRLDGKIAPPVGYLYSELGADAEYTADALYRTIASLSISQSGQYALEIDARFFRSLSGHMGVSIIARDSQNNGLSTAGAFAIAQPAGYAYNELNFNVQYLNMQGTVFPPGISHARMIGFLNTTGISLPMTVYYSLSPRTPSEVVTVYEGSYIKATQLA